MPTLSLVMIVKNETACLADCLASARPVVDEMVVADTGSTDDTSLIAERFGARVLQIPWRDDFATARNAALSAASGDWLLHLDADEALDPDGARRIRALVDADGLGADAIEVTLANYCDDIRSWRWTPVAPDDPMARGHAGCIDVALLRLFRNRRGFEYREPVHENITESVIERGGVIRAEPIRIHHYGYAAVPPESKRTLYFRIAKAKIEQRPDDPKAWYDLAELAFASGETETAETACRRALELLPLNLPAATLLANLMLNRGDLEPARALLEQLERAGESSPHIGTALAAIACKQGRLDEARQRLDTILERSHHSVQALLCLARVFDRLGDPDGARACLARAHAIAPMLREIQDHVQAHALRMEGERQYQSRDPRGALQTLVDALYLDPEDPITHNDIGVVLAALGKSEAAAESFRRALLLAPGMAEAAGNLAALHDAPSPGKR